MLKDTSAAQSPSKLAVKPLALSEGVDDLLTPSLILVGEVKLYEIEAVKSVVKVKGQAVEYLAEAVVTGNRKDGSLAVDQRL